MTRCPAALWLAPHDVGWRQARDAAGRVAVPHSLVWTCAVRAGRGRDDAAAGHAETCETHQTPDPDQARDADSEVTMWVKLDDHFVDHPKVIAAGPLAGWLYIAALCYANRLLTDGFIPRDLVTRLLPQNGHKTGTLVQRLCEVGLWIETTAAGIPGYQIHDYAQYQPSKQRVLKERKQTAKRQGRWRKRVTKNKTTP